VMIGGDIPYDNGMPSCYRAWDMWIHYWEVHMITPQGHTIPMLLSVGNHEAGGLDMHPAQLDLYLKWFPQSIFNFEKERQLSYHSHVFSDHTFILALDSQIVAQPDGEQLKWLNQQLSTATPLYAHKYACYHVPLYPSFRTYDNSYSTNLRKHWLKPFDDYGLDVSFENHDHAYKRSKLLKNDKEDVSGTLYMGDGSWGVAARPAKANDRWYLDVVKSINFLLLVEVNSTTTSMHAIDPKNTIVDTYVKAA